MVLPLSPRQQSPGTLREGHLEAARKAEKGCQPAGAFCCGTKCANRPVFTSLATDRTCGTGSKFVEFWPNFEAAESGCRYHYGDARGLARKRHLSAFHSYKEILHMRKSSTTSRPLKSANMKIFWDGVLAVFEYL